VRPEPSPTAVRPAFRPGRERSIGFDAKESPEVQRSYRREESHPEEGRAGTSG